MNRQVGSSGKARKQIQAAQAKRLQFGRHGEPYLEKDRDGFFAIAALGSTANGKMVSQEFLQTIADTRSAVASQDKVGRLL
jgi:hypothetical protein